MRGGDNLTFYGGGTRKKLALKGKIEVRFSIDHITKQRKGLPFCDDEDVLLHHHHKMPSHTITITFFGLHFSSNRFLLLLKNSPTGYEPFI